MQKYLKKLYLLLFISLVPGNGQEIFAQMSSDLKKFLWEKDFNELITDYAEEKIILTEQGEFKKRIERRSFIEAPGFRVQTFAGSSKENAAAIADQLTKLNVDSVYVVDDQGLFKVQIGNFTERLEAEKMLDQLRHRNFRNCWIVETIIHIPKQSKPLPDTDSDIKVISTPKFSIQLFVTKNEQRAKEFSAKFTRELGQPSRLIQSGDFWKVLCGSYSEEFRARQRLDEIRNSGYPDAWITQVTEE